MGTYNSAVITNGGQSMIAQAVAGASLEFTTIKTSNYAYPAGTNLATLTTINGIRQSKDITSATVYNSRVIKISATVDNTGISTAYTINTIGIYAKVGSSAESLFAVVTASAADTMPAYDSKPYSYIYEVNLTMQNAANVTVTVNTAGLVNVADLNAAKVEIQGEIADLKSHLNYKADVVFGGTPETSYLILTAGKAWDSSGRIIDNTKRAASAQIDARNGEIKLKAKNGYDLFLYGNNTDSVHPLTRITSGWVNEYEIVPVNYKYLYVTVKRSDNADITSDVLTDAIAMGKYSTVMPYALEKDTQDMKAEIDEAISIGEKGVNVSFTRHDEGYINPSNGTIVSATTGVAYTKINVNPGEAYYVSAYLTSNVGIAFYQKNGTFISGSGISSDTVGTNNIIDMKVDVPQNAYIMGVSTRYQSTSPIVIQKVEPLYGNMKDLASAIEETATGDFVIIDDAGKLPAKEISSTISNASSGTVIVSGKNLMPRITPTTSKGVVFTINDDGSVSAVGTSDANNAYAYVRFPSALIKILKGKRICVSGGGDSSSYIQLEVKVPGSTYYRTTEASGYFTYVVPDTTTSITASVNVRNSGTVINKTFYPQIEILKEYPSSYEKSNVTLYTASWNTQAGTITEGSVNLTTGDVTDGTDSYEIDPIEVVLNFGRNYIFSDCGNVTVKYNADSTLYETTDVISKMPEYVQKNLAVKHIGQLSKAYFCLTCDDGEEELATYTIPMIIEKNVPMTFCIWGTSEVMGDSSLLAIVKDAVDNHGCSIAQHGRDAWVRGEQFDGLVPTEQQLYEFFEAEKAIFEGAGLEVKGCSCPYGYVTPRLMAQCGGYFDVFRTTNYYTTGYNVFYDHGCCGPRSNLYGLYSRNITAYTLQEWKDNIDYAIENNYLIVPYFHDSALTPDNKVLLEAIIDYAKAQGITFCTLGEIPFLT